jgi:DNA helicase-2/ATP-dependent DNA helicase PcrA
MLTNKSIAKELGFENLYQVFNNRYSDPKEYLDEVLIKLQFKELYELYSAYNNHEYNFVLSQLKKSGLSIKSLYDKQTLKEHIEKITNSKLSATELISDSFKNKLIKQNEEFNSYLKQKQVFIDSIKEDIDYQAFKSHYIDNHTYTKMKKIREIEEGKFKELERKVKKENFYRDLFSKKINFHEIINYFEYIDEKTEYITMHKTKGSSIDNVLVVLDEYFWNEYSFKKLFQKENNEKKLKN